MPFSVVLSGGGARGAYGAGVLSYVFGELFSNRPVDFHTISGTSIGAVNGAHLAAAVDAPGPGMERLRSTWSTFDLADIIRFGPKELFGLPRVFLGGKGEAGVFDGRPLRKIVEELPWANIQGAIRQKRIHAFSVSTTHLATGRTYVFLDGHASFSLTPRLARRVTMVCRPIGPAHVCASSAIPVLFPPVDIDGELHCDGGLRQNTPIDPAIRLGSTRILVVAVSTGMRATMQVPPKTTPGLAFLLGKMLNAFLLDHVDVDLDHLAQMNEVLEDAARVGGPDFLDTLNAEARRRHRLERHMVRAVTVRPSQDIGRMAGDYLRHQQCKLRDVTRRVFFRALDVGQEHDADLASYLLFDAGFTKELLALGRRDAMALKDEICEALLGAT